MFNLLPEPEKKQILSEYNLRRNILMLIFLFVVGLIAVISIFPSYLLSSSKILEAQDGVSSIRNSNVFKEEESLNAELAQTNLKLSALQPLAGERYVSELFNAVITERSSGIRMNGLQYKRGDDKKGGYLSVSGVAQDRENLSQFVTALGKNSLFSKVDLPVSNFTKDRNADFTLQINGSFK
jgi:hypothetical protein